MVLIFQQITEQTLIGVGFGFDHLPV